MSRAIQEKVAVFGESRGLVGILTVPTSDPLPGAPHIVLLSTGILHRVGSSRLWVALARAFGKAGLTTLRFDYSGIGDSERRRDAGSMQESVDRDIRDAVEYLTKTRGAERVMLVGLCSGAFDAFLAAGKNPRVAGAVLIDMPGPFQTWRHTAYHLMSRVLRAESWKNPLKKLLYHSRMLLPEKPAPAAAVAEDPVMGANSTVAREQMRKQLDEILERKVQLYVIFTAGVETNYNHRSQFGALFPAAARHPAFSYDYFPDADHGFSGRDERARLVDGILRWALSDRGVVLKQNHG